MTSSDEIMFVNQSIDENQNCDNVGALKIRDALQAKFAGLKPNPKDRSEYEDLDGHGNDGLSKLEEHLKSSWGHYRPGERSNSTTQSTTNLIFFEPPQKLNESGCLPDVSADNTSGKSPTKWRRRENIWLVFYIILYVMYLVIGSMCFMTIESPMERSIRSDVQILKDQFLVKYPLMTEEDLEEFLKAIIHANDRGISPLKNATNDLNWSFGQALFFSSTVVTTIGYGHVTPLSQTGKIFCMIYATIGIPLTLVLLSAVVERLLVPTSWLLGTLNSKLGHLYQPFNIRLLHLSIIVALVATFFFGVPTAIFAYLEPDWGALDAFYYCFISLTTIGLGDYIPGDGVPAESRSLYKVSITVYLVCGLIAMMLALTVFYDIPQLNLGQLFTENVNSETEKLRLSGNSATCYSGPSGLYMPQRNEEVRRAVVRIRPHGNDSPSPDEPPSSFHDDMRVP